MIHNENSLSVVPGAVLVDASRGDNGEGGGESEDGGEKHACGDDAWEYWCCGMVLYEKMSVSVVVVMEERDGLPLEWSWKLLL